jgi:hypothetical protein
MLAREHWRRRQTAIALNRSAVGSVRHVRWWSQRVEPANSIYVPPCFFSFFTRCF